MYAVTAQEKATEALEMLRENKDKYDIVVTAVVGLDMNGFSLLEIIGLEMDIPVISKLQNLCRNVTNVVHLDPLFHFLQRK